LGWFKKNSSRLFTSSTTGYLEEKNNLQKNGRRKLNVNKKRKLWVGSKTETAGGGEEVLKKMVLGETASSRETWEISTKMREA